MTTEKQTTSKYLMTEGPIARQILTFAIPIFIGRLFQQLYNTADSMIVGRLLGPSALAAVSSTGTLVYLLVGFFMGFSTGAGVIIGYELGAGEHEEVSKTVHTSVAVGCFFSVLLTFVGMVFCGTFLTWLGTPDDVMPEATTYLRWYFAGSTGLVFYNIFMSILQASGDSKHPLYYLIFSSLLNVALDFIFVGGLNMGVGGAAFATAISQMASAVLAGIRLTHTDEAIKIHLSKVRFHMTKVKEIVRYGFPNAVQASVIDLANLMIQAYINSFGTMAMAGNGAYTKLEGFVFIPVIAFSSALTTFIAQNKGAGKLDRVRKGMGYGLLGGVIAIEVIGALLYIFAEPLVALFDTTPEVVRYGALRGHICSWFVFLLGFSHISSAAMRGLGRPVVPAVVMLVCWCAVRVAVLMTIGQVVHDIRLVFWIYPITWGLSTITYIIYLLMLKKKGVF